MGAGHDHKGSGRGKSCCSGGGCNGSSKAQAAPPVDPPAVVVASSSATALKEEHQRRRESARSEQRRVRAKLIAATVFAVLFMSVEVAGGIIAGSLAIVTDAAHLFTDVANFITAILASHLSEQPASSKHSYGLVRAEVLSALINTGVIVMLAAYLVYEGVRRIISWFQGNAVPIDGFLMMVVAIIGVVFNVALLLIFGHHHGPHEQGGGCGGRDHGHAHSHAHGHSHGHSHGNGKAARPRAHSHDEERGHGHSHRHGHGHHHHHHEEDEGTDDEEEHGGLHHRRPHALSGHSTHMPVATTDEHSHHSHPHSRHGSMDTAHGSVNGGGGGSGRASRCPSTGSEKGGLLVEAAPGGVAGSYGSVGGQPHAGLSHGHGHAHGHGYGHAHGHGNGHSHGKGEGKKNINLEAAHLHVITDLVQSVGVALAGVVIYFKPHWQIVDPICTIVFSILICYSTLSMLAKSTHVLLEGVPEGVDPDALHDQLRRIRGVTDVHDLHIWMLSIGRPIVTVHIKAADPEFAMREAQAMFMAAGIDHTTIQVQKDECLPNECDHPCVSVACVSTSPGGSPGGCTYV